MLLVKSDFLVKIERGDWINDIFEYGLCTRITSSDTSVPAHSLCPQPLKCQARRDKYVCSCGINQFRDIDDPTRCGMYIIYLLTKLQFSDIEQHDIPFHLLVYFIGKTTSSSNDHCPTQNARRNSTTGVCQCAPGYQVTNQNRQCGSYSSSFF
jgi:hypothetical protein